MGRKPSAILTMEEKRLQIIHSHQTALRKKLTREIKTKKATKRQPGEENYKKNMAIFLKIGIPGISHTDIAARLGETKSTVRKWFYEDPYVIDQYQFIQNNLKDSALELLEFYAIEAIETLVLLMRFGSEKLMKESAVELLDRIGIAKISKSEVDTTSHRKHEWEDQSEMLEKIRQLPPEKQEEAIAGLEKLQQLLLGQVDEIEKEQDELPPLVGKKSEEDDEEDDDETV